MSNNSILVALEPLHPDGEETQFGEGGRWNGGTFELTEQHLKALQTGHVILLDVQGEYVVNLRLLKEE